MESMTVTEDSGLCNEDDMMQDLLRPEVIQHSCGTIEIPVPRSVVPSAAQIEGLIRFMINKPSIATGHARSTLARQRSRDTWREIADFLNSDGCGCVKTWEQWSKYWRDKKASLKRKVAAIAAARETLGEEEAPELTEADKKILAIMAGECISEDRSSDIDLFQDTELDGINGSQEPYQNDRLDDTYTTSEVTSRMAMSREDGAQTESNASPTMSESDVRPNGINSTASSGRIVRKRRPRRRLLQQLPRGSVRPARLLPHPPAPAIQRRLQPPPRTQRRPKTPDRTELSLSERLVIVEEQRAKTELALAQAQESYARSQEALARGQQDIVQAITQLTDAVIALVNK